MFREIQINHRDRERERESEREREREWKDSTGLIQVSQAEALVIDLRAAFSPSHVEVDEKWLISGFSPRQESSISL